jgi:hypothetical protein
MPGLLRGIARTAAIAGTASAVSGRVQRHQAEKFAGRDQNIAANQAQGWYQGAAPSPAPAPAPAPVPAGPSPMLDQLRQLGELRDSGVLTPAEFDAQKAKVLAAG